MKIQVFYESGIFEANCTETNTVNDILVDLSLPTVNHVESPYGMLFRANTHLCLIIEKPGNSEPSFRLQIENDTAYLSLSAKGGGLSWDQIAAVIDTFAGGATLLNFLIAWARGLKKANKSGQNEVARIVSLLVVCSVRFWDRGAGV